MKRVVLACALLFGSTTVMAQTTGFYFDAALGMSTPKNITKSKLDYLNGLSTSEVSSFDDKGTFWSAAAGYRPWPYFAADVGFAELGTVKYRINQGNSLVYKANMSSSGPTLAAMGILPIGSRFEIHGRGGLIFARSSYDAYFPGSGNASVSAKSRDFFVGAEAAFNITETVAVRLSVHRFLSVGDSHMINGSDIDKSDIDTFSLGFTFRQ